MITSWREFYDALLRSPSHVIEGAALEQWLANPRGDFEAMARRLCGGPLSKEISAFIGSIYNPSGHERLKLAREAFERIYGPGNTKTQATSTYYAAHTMSPRPVILTAGELYSILLDKGSEWAGVIYRACHDDQVVGFVCDSEDIPFPDFGNRTAYDFARVLGRKARRVGRAEFVKDFHAAVRGAWLEFQRTLPKAPDRPLILEDVIDYVLNASVYDASELNKALELGMGWQHIAQKLGRTQNPQGYGMLNVKWTEAHNARRGEHASLYKSLLEAISKGAEL